MLGVRSVKDAAAVETATYSDERAGGGMHGRGAGEGGGGRQQCETRQ